MVVTTQSWAFKVKAIGGIILGLVIITIGLIIGVNLNSWKIPIFSIIIGLIIIIWCFLLFKHSRSTAEWQTGALGTRPYKRLAESNKKQNLFRHFLFGEVK